MLILIAGGGLIIQLRFSKLNEELKAVLLLFVYICNNPKTL
jgi:hypothetical protein